MTVCFLTYLTVPLVGSFKSLLTFFMLKSPHKTVFCNSNTWWCLRLNTWPESPWWNKCWTINFLEKEDMKNHIERNTCTGHYNDVIMRAIASQITSLLNVYSTVYSCADQRKHQNSASQAFVRWIHRWPVNSQHKWPVTRKRFPFATYAAVLGWARDFDFSTTREILFTKGSVIVSFSDQYPIPYCWYIVPSNWSVDQYHGIDWRYAPTRAVRVLNWNDDEKCGFTGRQLTCLTFCVCLEDNMCKIPFNTPNENEQEDVWWFQQWSEMVSLGLMSGYKSHIWQKKLLSIKHSVILHTDG